MYATPHRSRFNQPTITTSLLLQPLLFQKGNKQYMANSRVGYSAERTQGIRDVGGTTERVNLVHTSLNNESLETKNSVDPTLYQRIINNPKDDDYMSRSSLAHQEAASEVTGTVKDESGRAVDKARLFVEKVPKFSHPPSASKLEEVDEKNRTQSQDIADDHASQPN